MTVLYSNPYSPDTRYQYGRENTVNSNQIPMTLGVAIYLSWCSGLLAIVTSALLFGTSCTGDTEEYDQAIDKMENYSQVNYSHALPANMNYSFNKTEYI